MHPDLLRQWADQLAAGVISLDEFMRAVSPGIADLGDVQIDLARGERCGFPEVIFGEGKSADTLIRTIAELARNKVHVLATRVGAEMASTLAREFPGSHYNAVGRTFRLAVEGGAPARHAGRVAIVTAGTTDAPIAEEARETADWTGAHVTLVQDVGVAGPQRLQAALPQLRAVDAIVVVAGMEGALPSVVGGHVACPVFGVPTSVGYGANFGGLSALLSMLNSCAANVCVVNIDAGFKGGFLAGLTARRMAEARK